MVERYILYKIRANYFAFQKGNFCLFLLNGTVRVHLEKYLLLRDYTEIVRQLLLNLCVDDKSNSFNSIEQSFNFYKISKTC